MTFYFDLTIYNALLKKYLQECVTKKHFLRHIYQKRTSIKKSKQTRFVIASYCKTPVPMPAT